MEKAKKIGSCAPAGGLEWTLLFMNRARSADFKSASMSQVLRL